MVYVIDSESSPYNHPNWRDGVRIGPVDEDRVTEFSYKAGGGKIAPLFDGTEKVVSIDALHWYNRGVYLP